MKPANLIFDPFALNKYFPASIEAILRSHSTGTLETILVWLYVILMAMFWYFVLRMLIRRIH
jgi:hypothetical protein